MLQYWTQSVELDLTAGRTREAYETLAEVLTPFESSAYSREFCRVARLLLNVSDWVSEHGQYPKFERVFRAHIEMLSYLGEHKEVEGLLQQYERTVPVRDSRYIAYAELRCTTKWLQGEFKEAVEWGRTGKHLKDTSQVDTDISIDHALALAERDAGNSEVALQSFLNGEPLSRVVDPRELTKERGGPFYGNIGRCLHLMGQVESALVCYQKSALLIETDPTYEHVINQGYIRAWVGELLVAREEFQMAAEFYAAAAAKWKHVFPSRACKMADLARQVRQRVGRTPLAERDSESLFRGWIFGHEFAA